MPTSEELEELINADNCSWTKTSINGINCCKVQSKKAGFTDNWIFLPAAGYLDINYYFSNVDLGGHYWSSSLNTDNPCNAFYLTFTPNSAFCFGYVEGYYFRYNGLSVRPVSE